jgi:hypothetical protein
LVFRFVFETGSCCVAQAGFELLILLLQLLELLELQMCTTNKLQLVVLSSSSPPPLPFLAVLGF